jgi:NAD-dependent DNA ligase
MVNGKMIERYAGMVNVEMIERHAKNLSDKVYLKLRNDVIEVIEREDQRRGF